MADDAILYGLGTGLQRFQQQQKGYAALHEAANQFDQLGTPRAQAMANLIRTDPGAYRAFAKEFGGTGSLYEQLYNESIRQAQAQAASALSAVGSGAVPPDQLAGILQSGAQAGIPPTDMLAAAQRARDLQTASLPPDLGLLKVLGIQPEDWTNESLNAFMQNWKRNAGEVDWNLLVPRPGIDLPNPPAGYAWHVAGDLAETPEGMGEPAVSGGQSYYLLPIPGHAGAQEDAKRALLLHRVQTDPKYAEFLDSRLAAKKVEQLQKKLGRQPTMDEMEANVPYFSQEAKTFRAEVEMLYGGVKRLMEMMEGF